MYSVHGEQVQPVEFSGIEFVVGKQANRVTIVCQYVCSVFDNKNIMLCC